MTQAIIQCVIKNRDQLNADLSEYLEKGGKIRVLPHNQARYVKENTVRRGLFYSVHLQRISNETKLRVVELRSLKRSLITITDYQLNTLYEYFKDRDLTKI